MGYDKKDIMGEVSKAKALLEQAHYKLLGASYVCPDQDVNSKLKETRRDLLEVRNKIDDLLYYVATK